MPGHGRGDAPAGATPSRTTIVAIVLGIELAIALVHVLHLGRLLEGVAFTLYTGFASDVLVPFGIYFLLVPQEGTLPALRPWAAKAALVFAAASFAEVAQGLGVPLLGRTFDPLDFIMFAIGVLLAAVMDRRVLAPCCRVWRERASPLPD